jgi:peptidyl-prolyl cis-trans isomerase C
MNTLKRMSLALCLALLGLGLTIGCEEQPATDVQAEKDKAPEAAETPAEAPAEEPAETSAEEAEATAEEAAETPAEEAPAPAAEVAPLPDVVATVGDVEITSKEVDTLMGPIPENIPANLLPYLIHQARAKVLSGMIFNDLLNTYLAKNNVQYTEEDVAEIKKQLDEAAKAQNMTTEQLMAQAGYDEDEVKNSARAKALLEEKTSDEKLQAFIKDHPNYFNGTKVTASHILLKADPTGSTKDQKAAWDKLEELKKKITAGEMTFDEAATANSACPSKAQGGDLGEFGFTQMVPPFAVAAFDAKVDELVGPVRSQFGFHLIKTTQRTDGSAEPSPQAKETAKNTIMSLLQNDVLNQVLSEVPVEIFLPEAPPRPAMPGQPTGGGMAPPPGMFLPATPKPPASVGGFFMRRRNPRPAELAGWEPRPRLCVPHGHSRLVRWGPVPPHTRSLRWRDGNPASQRRAVRGKKTVEPELESDNYSKPLRLCGETTLSRYARRAHNKGSLPGNLLGPMSRTPAKGCSRGRTCPPVALTKEDKCAPGYKLPGLRP